MTKIKLNDTVGFIAVFVAIFLFFYISAYAGADDQTDGPPNKADGETEGKEVESSWLESLPRQTRSRGGVCAVIGEMDGLDLAEELLASGPWTIHWLNPRAEEVEQAREALHDRGNYGRITVEHWDRKHLPYSDNLVNLIILSDGETPFDREEVLRVLAPEGSILVGTGEEADNVTRVTKPRPDESGEWTHPWHDADGSLSASDRMFDVPNAFQWVAGPPVPLRGRKASAGAVLSAGGRVFQITFNVAENLPFASERPNHLVARDAYNGTLLWSREWEGPFEWGQQWGPYTTIVAGTDRLYGAGEEKINVFDAATGEIISTWPVEDTPDKLLLVDEVLIAESETGLSAFDTVDGRKLGHLEVEEPWGTLAADGNVYCLSSSREKDGQWRHELIAAQLDSGMKLWSQPLESQGGHKETTGLRLHFAGEGIVCLIEGQELRFFSAEDGKLLWREETIARARGGHDSRMAGHFLFDGKVWIRRGGEERHPYTVHDPVSGELLRGASGSRGTRDAMRRCQPMTATPRFAIDAGRARMWEFESGEFNQFKFARGGCQVGLAVADGMAYMAPNACGCLSEQYRGNLAIVHSKDEGLRSIRPGSLERGPAYGTGEQAGDSENPDTWPIYRRDSWRGAYLPQRITADLREGWQSSVASKSADDNEEWRLNFGRPLTPPVVAGGLILLAEPQSHRVIALDENNGEMLWRYTAGGRVTTPPSIHGDLALFGAHDGYIYAVRTSDGELAWRRRVAPSDRRIVAYGQVESAWPVTNVLLHEGTAFAAAGRAADAGGGAAVHAVEPATGELLWSSRIGVHQARHGKPDLLVADGENVYLMNQRLDMRTGEISSVDFGIERIERSWNESSHAKVRYPEGVRYLRSGQAGFLATAWTGRDMALRKHMSSWSWGESEGEILAFDGEAAYAFQIDAGDNMWYRARTWGGGIIKAYSEDGKSVRWLREVESPEQIQAMVLTDEVLFIAGPKHRGQSEGAGFLRAIDREDGGELAKITLPAVPIHDGLAAARGNLFVVLKNGSVMRLESQ